MTPSEEMIDSVRSFAESCNENQQLPAMIRDWNRAIHIHATDAPAGTPADAALVTSGGHVQFSAAAPHAADLRIDSDAATLARVFYGELSPNEPYNAGTLRIAGAEGDIVRLDFVIAMLWGE